MTDTMIRLEGVSKTFAGMDRPAVGHLSLEIARGELVTLVGPSGCGKTTTLKMINRIIEPTSGEIWVDGTAATSVAPHQLRRNIGYVIQQIGLFPHRTIAQNIGTVPELLGWDQARVDARVGELVELVGLDGAMLGRYPAELSGGQQQRVGVARALAADPPVLLMDEPFGAVDPVVRGHLQDELVALQDELHKTVVFVTHDIDEAMRLGDRIALLNVGGVLEQYDTPEAILAQPANRFVEDFIGGERGLRRLGLVEVDSGHIQRGPVVDVSEGVEAARAAMEAHQVDWVGLVEEGRLLGWVWGSELNGSGNDLWGATPTPPNDDLRGATPTPPNDDLRGATPTPPNDLRRIDPRPFLIELGPRSTLRQALDAVVTSAARVAVVVEEGRYVGMVDLEAIAEELAP